MGWFLCDRQLPFILGRIRWFFHCCFPFHLCCRLWWDIHICALLIPSHWLVSDWCKSQYTHYQTSFWPGQWYWRLCLLSPCFSLAPFLMRTFVASWRRTFLVCEDLGEDLEFRWLARLIGPIPVWLLLLIAFGHASIVWALPCLLLQPGPVVVLTPIRLKTVSVFQRKVNAGNLWSLNIRFCWISLWGWLLDWIFRLFVESPDLRSQRSFFFSWPEVTQRRWIFIFHFLNRCLPLSRAYFGRSLFLLIIWNSFLSHPAVTVFCTFDARFL